METATWRVFVYVNLPIWDNLNIKIKKYIEEIRQEKGVTISLVPIKDFRIDSGSSSMRMIGILIILATVILFIVTLNYVLISISSMSRRAKSIGYINVMERVQEVYSPCLCGKRLLFLLFRYC